MKSQKPKRAIRAYFAGVLLAAALGAIKGGVGGVIGLTGPAAAAAGAIGGAFVGLLVLDTSRATQRRVAIGALLGAIGGAAFAWTNYQDMIKVIDWAIASAFFAAIISKAFRRAVGGAVRWAIMLGLAGAIAGAIFAGPQGATVGAIFGAGVGAISGAWNKALFDN